MAAAALQATPGTERCYRIYILVKKGGSKIIRGLFDYIHPPSTLANTLQNQHKGSLEDLKRRKVLFRVQWDKLFPTSSSYGNSEDFDLTLLFKLLRSICNLTEPSTGWDKLPNDADLSLEADVARIKYHRNAFAHNDEMEISENEFNDYWVQVKDALLRIVGIYAPYTVKEWEEEIDKSRTAPITEEDRKSYLSDLPALVAPEAVKEVTGTIKELSLYIVHGTTTTDCKSKFQAHFAEVTSQDQVHKVLDRFTKNSKYAEASNIIWASRVFEADESLILSDSEDGGEYLAGRRLEYLLKEIDARNVVVIVTCWQGEVYLGLDTFKNINECALNLLVSHELVKYKTPEEVELFSEKIEDYFESRKRKAAHRLVKQAEPKASAEFEIIHGEITPPVRKSKFQAHLARVTSQDQVEQVLTQLKKDRKIAGATYNMLAYRIYIEDKKTYLEEGRDGGETRAGRRLLELLQVSKVENVVVIVTRWHGGVHIGPDRFKHIIACATEVIKLASERRLIGTKTSAGAEPQKQESKKKGKSKGTRKHK